MMTLGNKLQNMRKQKGLSQEQLANMITVSRQAVSKWETNETIPDIGNLLQLSKLFEVSLDFLLNDEIEDNKEIPIVLSTVKKEKKKWIMIGILILVVVIALALYLGQRFHILGLVTSYLILIVFISLIALCILFLFKVVHIWGTRK